LSKYDLNPINDNTDPININTIPKIISRIFELNH
jgi:hypothetical protein